MGRDVPNFWWVNQNKTYRQETKGGYLWSPKRKRNGARNPFYDHMRLVTPGDIILSFAETRMLCRSGRSPVVAWCTNARRVPAGERARRSRRLSGLHGGSPRLRPPVIGPGPSA